MTHLNNALLYCEAQRDSLTGVITPSRGAFGWIDWDDARLTLIYLLEKEERHTMYCLPHDLENLGPNYPNYPCVPTVEPSDDERNVDAWDGGFTWNH